MIVTLARIAIDPGTSPELKVRCYAELAQYVYPKRKAMTVEALERIEAEPQEIKIVFVD